MKNPHQQDQNFINILLFIVVYQFIKITLFVVGSQFMPDKRNIAVKSIGALWDKTSYLMFLG
jgi:hypothetical protein